MSFATVKSVNSPAGPDHAVGSRHAIGSAGLQQDAAPVRYRRATLHRSPPATRSTKAARIIIVSQDSDSMTSRKNSRSWRSEP